MSFMRRLFYMIIQNIVARSILDSRGNPTVEVDVHLEGEHFGRASVPSGASTGVHEAHELRDGEQAYGGLGVLKAIQGIRDEILPALRGMPAYEQAKIDKKMLKLDGTKNKSRLGANALLAVSLAVAHAAAKGKGQLLYRHINDLAGNPEMSLPMPMMNVLNGGRHALGSSDFQEFMIVPARAESYAQAVQIGVEIFQNLKALLAEHGFSTAVGDEGGFTYPAQRNITMLELLVEASHRAGHPAGQEVFFALDVAASEFYNEAHNSYTLERENRSLNAQQLIAYLREMTETFPVVSIEDGLAQDAWSDWVSMHAQMPFIQQVGDDLLVTNPERLRQAIQMQAANAILIKPNQIGTLTETLETIQLAQSAGWRTIVSHRSGETEDISIAHIAVGTGAGQIKTGSVSRTDRTAKHNELMRLESIDETLKLAKPFK
jgi:enolase